MGTSRVNLVVRIQAPGIGGGEGGGDSGMK